MATSAHSGPAKPTPWQCRCVRPPLPSPFPAKRRTMPIRLDTEPQSSQHQGPESVIASTANWLKLARRRGAAKSRKARTLGIETRPGGVSR